MKKCNISMKSNAKYILMFILGLNLTGCVSVIKVNFASKVQTNQTMDDFDIGQDYETEVTDNSKKKRK